MCRAKERCLPGRAWQPCFRLRTGACMFAARDRWLVPLLESICPATVMQGIQEQARRSGSHWKAALEMGVVDDGALLDLVARKTRTPVAARLSVSSQARELVPEEVARRYGILPLAIGDSVIDIA